MSNYCFPLQALIPLAGRANILCRAYHLVVFTLFLLVMGNQGHELSVVSSSSLAFMGALAVPIQGLPWGLEIHCCFIIVPKNFQEVHLLELRWWSKVCITWLVMSCLHTGGFIELFIYRMNLRGAKNFSKPLFNMSKCRTITLEIEGLNDKVK